MNLRRKRHQVSDEMFSASKKVGVAIKDYDMLQTDDRLLVVIDGTAQALVNLELLVFRQSFAPILYELKVVLIVPLVSEAVKQYVLRFCQEHHIVYSEEILDYCDSLKLAKQNNCNKIAASDFLDDFVEQMIESMFIKGKLFTRPLRYCLGEDWWVIYPFAYVTEELLQQVIKQDYVDLEGQFRIKEIDEKRIFIRQIIDEFQQGNSAVKKNIFNSILNIKSEYLMDAR